MNDDALLVQRAQKGDAAAYSELMLRHSQAVRAVALSFGAEWEDIVQETFTRAYASITSLESTAKFREWTLGIARNVCRDEIRKKARPQRPPELDPRRGEPDKRLDDLRNAVDALPDEYRVAIEMRYFEQLGHDEIGRRLGLGRNGVNARLTRARAMLRERMKGS